MDASASAEGASAAREQATREMPAVGAAPAGPSPAAAQDAGGDVFTQRPELFVGAAFVGGVVLAQLLKRVGR
jgi:predicted lipid-binding transport protein (Tim44 family)